MRVGKETFNSACSRTDDTVDKKGKEKTCAEDGSGGEKVLSGERRSKESEREKTI